ncbi:hypothetical protein GCM10028820_00540 [Tessaracoccus terricola]
MNSKPVTEAPTPQVGASSPYQKFDRYTMITLYSVTPLAPLMSAMLLSNATAYSWATIPHVVALLVTVVLCALVLRHSVLPDEARLPWPRLLVAAFFAAGLAAAGFGAFAAPPTGDSGIDVPTSLVLISLTTLAFGFSPAIPWRRTFWCAVAVAAPTTAVWLWLHPGLFATGRWVPTTVTSLLVTFGILMSGAMAAWTLKLMREQAELTVVRSELAVAEERLRFSRDLHDIFGRTLTAVAVKSDLAAELATAGQVERATSEMREVHDLADQGLREVRDVVAGYRAVDLGAELKGARAMLTAAGIHVRLIGDAAGIGPGAAEALAWAVREGATNVVHHSDARTCTIKLAGGDGVAEVTITNDGVGDRPPRPGGGGLDGLRARLGRLGGGVETSRERDTFTLTARVPEETA